MKRLSLSSFFLSSLIAAGVARAEDVTPSADTYGRYSYSNAYGSDSTIYVKNAGATNGATRKGVIKFNRESITSISAATLYLDVSSFNDTAGATSATFSVWGIKNNASVENFSESTANYSTF